MKMPWQDKIGLAKAFAILASALTISLGLCGVNAAVSISAHYLRSGPVALLISTGVAGLTGIVLSAAGLLVVAIVWVVREIILYVVPPGRKED